jgi:hypothetical protein
LELFDHPSERAYNSLRNNGTRDGVETVQVAEGKVVGARGIYYNIKTPKTILDDVFVLVLHIQDMTK